jgi:tRNA(adenine34) deaminase
MNDAPTPRRRIALAALLLVLPAASARAAPQARWYDAAEAMRRLALSWGDQPYGAVLVLDERIVGEGPSRVVQRGDPDAHAEREAIRDARQRLGLARTQPLPPGAVLYSTSRPCAACEAAAAAAGVARMVHGAALHDAGRPRAMP